MKQILAAFALLLVAAPAVRGQPAVPPASGAYSGPRFPGGPDSLRALVYRSTRLATPAPAGKALLLFELGADGRPGKFRLVAPPGPLNLPLLTAAASALDYLQARMPNWQPGAPDPEAKPAAEPPENALVLDFAGSAPGARPYHYPDQSPQFPAVANLLRNRQLPYLDQQLADPAKRAAFTTSVKGVVAYVQMQVRYPPQALRAQQEGRVYASFEVAETGAIEHAEILGTAGRALDAEVLWVVRRLPAAGSPALLHGRPVRVQYVLPITFKIQ